MELRECQLFAPLHLSLSSIKFDTQCNNWEGNERLWYRRSMICHS